MTNQEKAQKIIDMLTDVDGCDGHMVEECLVLLREIANSPLQNDTKED